MWRDHACYGIFPALNSIPPPSPPPPPPPPPEKEKKIVLYIHFLKCSKQNDILYFPVSYFIYGLKYQNEKKYQGQISQTWYEAGLCDPHFLSVTHHYFIDTKAMWARVNCDRSRDPNMSW